MYISITAYIALVLFIPFSAALFAVLRPHLAATITFFVAVMFLPERVAFDAPLLPPIDKLSLSGLCAFLGCLFTARPKLRQARPFRGFDWLFVLMVLGFFGESATNKDTFVFGPLILPPLGMHEAIAASIRTFLGFYLPFFLGRALIRTPDEMRDLALVATAAALVYVPFIAYELRMSPQLHRIVYGFHQHDFIQTIRAGGYRPMVFMQHGLALAMFLLAAAIFATALAKARVRFYFGFSSATVAVFLFVLLLICKSFGALIYAVVLIPLILFVRAKRQLTVAAILSMLVFAYPVLRTTGWFPAAALVDLSAQASQDRAESLDFRFKNEDRLVAKAIDRPWFGWGSYGRNRLYDDWGNDISVTDGHWIIVLGAEGVIGFLATFGMLLGPVFAARRTLPFVSAPRDRVLFSALALVVAIDGVDLLPNGLYSHLPIFLAGALAGLCAGLKSPFSTHMVNAG